MRISRLRGPVLLLAIMGFGASAMAAAASASPTANGGAGSAHHTAAIPAALRPALYQAMAKDAGPAYAIGKDGCATSPEENLVACFANTGVRFTLPAGQGGAASPLALHLVAWGRSSAGAGEGGKLTTVKAVQPVIQGNEASYAHGDLTEWWRVLPMGFEQGFTIAKRPAGHGKLTLALAANSRDGGTSSIRHSRAGGKPVEPIPFPPSERRGTEGDALTGFRLPLRGPEMMTKANALAWGKLRYGKLVVTDAKGRVIPATLTSKGNHILIAVNDARAIYPLTVDPLVWIEQKVNASGATAGDGFGRTVAIDGTTALLGEACAAADDSATQQCGPGATYVFTESKGVWSQTQELTASDGMVGDAFGSAVALSGATAIIGAACAVDNPHPRHCDGHGAAYVFTKLNGHWSQTQKLTANDGASQDEFGDSIALSSGFAVIGANQATVNDNVFQGAAYVFDDSNGTWAQAQKLTASNGAEGDNFGVSAALWGTTAVIGASCAPYNPIGYCGPVEAYVFTRSGGTWTEVQTLTASDGTADDQFGIAVALSGSVALVGADFAAINGNGLQGAVYVFSEGNGGWAQTQKLTASNGATADLFGSSVTVSGTIALIGAETTPATPMPDPNEYQPGPGAAYLFTEANGAWSQTQEVRPSDGTEGDGFGWAVGISGAKALIGAPCSHYDPDTFECGAGAAYFYGEGDLGLNVSAPETAVQGQKFTSQAIATNNASAASPAISVTIAVPAAASFVSASASQGSCSEDSDVVTCNFGAIDGNAGTATANLTLKATGNAGTTIENVAGVARATPSLTASAPTVIQKANSPPVAQNGTLTTEENTAANGTLDASDPDGDPLTFLIVDKPKHGTVSQGVKGSNDYLYTPDHGYSGADSFTFKASDGQADSNVATISITVKAASPPPSGGGGGGGATAPLGLGLLALVGLLALLRRKRQVGRSGKVL